MSKLQALYALLAISAAAFSFCAVWGFTLAEHVSSITGLFITALSHGSLEGLIGSAASMVSIASLIRQTATPTPKRPNAETTAEEESAPTKQPADDTRRESTAKLGSTMLRGLATLEVNFHLDDQQLEEVAQIVLDRASRLRLQQLTQPPNEPVPAATEKPEPFQSNQGKEATVEHENEPAEISVPLVRHQGKIDF